MEATTNRFAQIVLIVTWIGFLWLAFQAVHELGHVILARLTGAEVTNVVLSPLVISRTDLGANPHPLAVVWGGALVGSLLPLAALGLSRACRLPGVYLIQFFAGFCLVANGTYIGTGWLAKDEADPQVMIANGSPVWCLVLFGLLAASFGLYLWHGQGRHFGLGKEADGEVNCRAALASTILFLGLVAFELIRNRWQ